eukprot:5906867-Prymnesium_polylepis.1
MTGSMDRAVVTHTKKTHGRNIPIETENQPGKSAALPKHTPEEGSCCREPTRSSTEDQQLHGETYRNPKAESLLFNYQRATRSPKAESLADLQRGVMCRGSRRRLGDVWE